ncbi:NAD-dependent succinate-semialdehyde dehydrogenase [Cyanobacterium aponinum FACHB-4101]|uniref:NAD-dependent succinate-semialdehyde dehydrogenase n=1 Tax=Cyanobacterium aponinum TaxID=379064 RepID=UPI0016805B6E|nr:NAD-dependent succinate-semialdehyde dehydrogenase [Cyanobacterium aponinum]MBD2395590.1 NAD-dependent succinate-semialdehyde dehydrogenase [Cyanobacterium aponinum FACHB-4101]
MAIATVNPTTEETLKIFTPLTAEEIEKKLHLAETTFQQYRLTSFAHRREKLLKAGEILENNARKWAEIITLEMGKPIKQALAEIKKCALVCRYYAENAESFLKPKTIASDASYSAINYQPLGIILAVMPWNFPFWQVLRFAVPALMAGNVGLLKHASNVPQCANAIASIFLEAGFPEGVFQSLLITSNQVEGVLRDKRVKAVTLTGSELAGRKVASVAGDELKKSVLELGGSDPFIVTKSANIEEAVKVAVTARTLNNGQSCIAAKRFILEDAIAPKFTELLLQEYQKLKIGNPFDETVDIGPLATANILEDIVQQVDETIAKGAKVLIGGKPLEGKGYFYPPTILTDIPINSPGMNEEFFAPVALIFTVKNIEEAIILANSTNFGLGASIWTNNQTEIDLAVRDIEAGSVFINGMVKSDPRLPFGGIKRSGYGRELSMEGMLEFMNIKTVWQK